MLVRNCIVPPVILSVRGRSADVFCCLHRKGMTSANLSNKKLRDLQSKKKKFFLQVSKYLLTYFLQG